MDSCDWLMCCVHAVRPTMREVTALGAALAAMKGIGLDPHTLPPPVADDFVPQVTPAGAHSYPFLFQFPYTRLTSQYSSLHVHMFICSQVHLMSVGRVSVCADITPRYQKWLRAVRLSMHSSLADTFRTFSTVLLALSDLLCSITV